MKIIKVDIILKDESPVTPDMAVQHITKILTTLFKIQTSFKVIVMDVVHRGEQG